MNFLTVPEARSVRQAGPALVRAILLLADVPSLSPHLERKTLPAVLTRALVGLTTFSQ